MESLETEPEYYDPDDVIPQSPPLVAITSEQLAFTPETAFLPSDYCSWDPLAYDLRFSPLDWTGSKRTRPQAIDDEAQPSPSREEISSLDCSRPHALDGVLLSHMSPNHPEISWNATALNPFGSDALYEFSQNWGNLFRQPEITETSSKRNIKERSRSRLGLPITIDAAGGPESVLACADTGAEENIISADLVKKLSLSVSNSSPSTEFMLASGKIVQAIGQVSALCSFGGENSSFAASMRCTFHVFPKLASPIIMGSAFLDQTDTMANYRERLVRNPRPNLQALQVYSLGRPRKNLMCYVAGELVAATPDSGSDLDIMTPQFAEDRCLQIEKHVEEIEFADGSTALACGFVQVDLAVRSSEASSSGLTTSKEC